MSTSGRAEITHRSEVPIGRTTGTITVDVAGCIRLTTPSIPNFYSDGWLGDIERKQARDMWRRTANALIEARFP